MRRSTIEKVLLGGACMLVAATAWGQQSPKLASLKPSSIDLALTYSPELGQTSYSKNSLWLQGGGLDIVAGFKNGFGLSASINGEYASNVATNVDIEKISYLAGPRYTANVFQGKKGKLKGHAIQIFGEALFGDAYAFNSVIPTSGGVETSANVFAMQLGGGINVPIDKHFGVRLLQADYVRTSFPNNVLNQQDDIRLSFGATYHFGLR